MTSTSASFNNIGARTKPSCLKQKLKFQCFFLKSKLI